MEMQVFTLTGRRIWADFSNGITVQVFEGEGLDLSPGPLLRKNHWVIFHHWVIFLRPQTQILQFSALSFL